MLFSHISQCSEGGVPEARGWFSSVALADQKTVAIFGGLDVLGRRNDLHLCGPF